MAGWGTFTLHEITSPPSPAVAVASSHFHGVPTKYLSTTPNHPLDIQVIGQEWVWTFRYPSFGGIETKELYVPVNTLVRLHITSLDVVHSFWSYDYDIKEDAVPGVVNYAWFQPTKLGSFTTNGKNWAKCNELCGIWHGYMRAQLNVVPQSTFVSWAKRQQAYQTSIGFLKVLPPYSEIYYPSSNSNWPPAPQDQSP
jgi:cytochrome c oxidase subunit 2